METTSPSDLTLKRVLTFATDSDATADSIPGAGLTLYQGMTRGRNWFQRTAERTSALLTRGGRGRKGQNRAPEPDIDHTPRGPPHVHGDSEPLSDQGEQFSEGNATRVEVTQDPSPHGTPSDQDGLSDHDDHLSQGNAEEIEAIQGPIRADSLGSDYGLRRRRNRQHPVDPASTYESSFDTDDGLLDSHLQTSSNSGELVEINHSDGYMSGWSGSNDELKSDTDNLRQHQHKVLPSTRIFDACLDQIEPFEYIPAPALTLPATLSLYATTARADTSTFLSSLSHYTALEAAHDDQALLNVLQQLHAKWTVYTGLLLALGGVVGTVIGFSSDGTLFPVDVFGKHVIALAAASSGIGISTSIYYYVVYSGIDAECFRRRALDDDNSFFVFSVSSLAPGFCMVVATVSLTLFLVRVAYTVSRPGVIAFGCFVLLLVQFQNVIRMFRLLRRIVVSSIHHMEVCLPLHGLSQTAGAPS